MYILYIQIKRLRNIEIIVRIENRIVERNIDHLIHLTWNPYIGIVLPYHTYTIEGL